MPLRPELLARLAGAGVMSAQETEHHVRVEHESIERRRFAAKRSADYAAAQLSRLTASWSSFSLSANEEIFRSLRTLRARSRELARNDAHAKRFLQMVETNVVGPNGIGLQNRAKEWRKDKGGKLVLVQDRVANALIEEQWVRWGKPGACEITGRLSFAAFQRLFIRTVARDGEALVRRLSGPRYAPHGYALQFLDVDRLDDQYHEDLPNGNKVRMGVEINSVGRPIAYHVLDRHPGHFRGVLTGVAQRERIPAEQMIHAFIADRPEQIRGIPWMHAAMLRLKMLGAGEEAAVIAFRIGASKMGFYESPDGNPAPLGTDEDKATGEIYDEAEPGHFGMLPPGYKFSNFDPRYPDTAYDPFVKACLRGVSSGLGVSYNSLASDLEGVNYSSIRQGVLDERDSWMTIQAWMTESCLDPVYADWIERMLLSGATTLPASKIDKFAAASWQPRRWQWVDPLKDVQANIAAIDKGLKSRRQVIAETGNDIEDVFADLAAEQELADELGIKLAAPPPAPAADDNNNDDDQQSAANGKKPKAGDTEEDS